MPRSWPIRATEREKRTYFAEPLEIENSIWSQSLQPSCLIDLFLLPSHYDVLPEGGGRTLSCTV